MDKSKNVEEFYDIKKQLFHGRNYSNLSYFKFKLKLFWRMNNSWFYSTPESDSLYRRRNRLIVIIMSLAWYFKTASSIFDRVELKVITGSSNIVLKIKGRV
jgi:hypothetical protein